MAKYASEAKEKVTITIEYPRPLFVFPDISGELGNPREYFKLATSELRRAGFYRESKELESLGFEPYATHFNNIARYLDYTNSQMESEDDEYIYIKIKKSDGSIEQPRCFGRVIPSHIQELIDDGHDFSLTNCYGRNHLHYTTELPAVKLLVEANKNNQWFDIFHLDCFNSTLLHGKRSFPVFGYLLEEMYNESPELTERFLYGSNVFGKNAFGEFLKACDVMFSFKNGEPKIEDLNGLGHVLKTLGKIDPEQRDKFITLFDVVEKKNPAFKKADYKAFILQAILEGELDVNNNAVKRKIKI